MTIEEAEKSEPEGGSDIAEKRKTTRRK